MPPNIQELCRLAEESFCKECFDKYIELLEPKLQFLLANPISDWRKIELEVTHLVMFRKGIFSYKKTQDNLLDGDDEKDFKITDRKAYRETKKWSFKQKIDYLSRERVLQKNSYEVLNGAREIRNRVHDYYSGFSEDDYLYFNMARKVANTLWSAVLVYKGKDSETLKGATESIAKQWIDYRNGINTF